MAGTDTGLFSQLLNAWDAPNPELALVQRAIGAAVLDDMRGQSGSLTDAYKSLGGTDPISTGVLESVDPAFRSWSLKPAADALSASKSATSFADAWTQWDVPSSEQALIERTVGYAYMERMKGNHVTPTAAYSELGGNNPQSVAAFQALEPIWSKVDPSPVLAAVANASVPD